MTKGQNAGIAAIAVEVEKDKSYYWCSCGQSRKNNLSVMDLTKVLSLLHLLIKLKKQKKCFFVLANKLIIHHFVMDHTINRRREK